MTPKDFRSFLDSQAARAGFPQERIILGGDHLGPYPWRSLRLSAQWLLHGSLSPRASGPVTQRSIWMPVCRWLATLRAALTPRGLPRGERRSLRRRQRRRSANTRVHPSSAPPVYVIGTEVPAPGGVASGHGRRRGGDGPRELRQTVALCEEAFRRLGLGDVGACHCVRGPTGEWSSGTDRFSAMTGKRPRRCAAPRARCPQSSSRDIQLTTSPLPACASSSKTEWPS